tara:strand:+ start:312 stop:545 length:234 start_codon:yes stop_codon:yes gene_type:complete
MKKHFISIFFLLISNVAFAGSCPMLWGKIDSSINNVADEKLKVKIQELRDSGKKAHSDGDHSESEKLLNEALSLINS